MTIIYISAGHGGRDPGAVGNGLREKDIVLDLALRLLDRLKAHQVEVMMARDGDYRLVDDDTADRTERIRQANEAGADLYFSIHCNGFGEPGPNGYEDFIYPGASQRTQEIRDRIHPHCARVWTDAGRANRGKKTANFHVLRETRMPAVLVEHGFVSNPTDANLLRSNAFRDQLTDGMLRGVVEAMDLQQTAQTPILGEPQGTVYQARQWARDRGAHQRFIDIANEYWRLGELLGIRPEVAYAQSAKETAFGRYGGAVHPDQNNWAGIKTATATGDRPEDHDTFESPEDGVRAHFNHLCAYVGKNPIGDPHGRYYLVTRFAWAGSIRYVEELGKRWAPNPDYGHSIVRDYLSGILATTAPEPPDVPEDPPHEVYVTQDDFDRLAARVGALESMIERVARALTK